jgi:hypothetical protein
MGEHRFAYEYAEATLDKFAATVSSRRFRRAYAKFKLLIRVYAFADFSYPHAPDDSHIAWAWEDAQIAFKGYGETLLHGAILQMWTVLSEQEQAQFLLAAGKGFYVAELETDRMAIRRYASKWRKSDTKNPSEGFDLPSVMPLSGVKVRDWATDEKLDPAGHEAFMRHIQKNERDLAIKPKTTKHLRVVEDGSENE